MVNSPRGEEVTEKKKLKKKKRGMLFQNVARENIISSHFLTDLKTWGHTVVDSGVSLAIDVY